MGGEKEPSSRLAMAVSQFDKFYFGTVWFESSLASIMFLFNLKDKHLGFYSNFILFKTVHGASCFNEAEEEITRNTCA
jgi:hypothetical protein